MNQENIQPSKRAGKQDFICILHKQTYVMSTTNFMSSTQYLIQILQIVTMRVKSNCPTLICPAQKGLSEIFVLNLLMVDKKVNKFMLYTVCVMQCLSLSNCILYYLFMQVLPILISIVMSDYRWKTKVSIVRSQSLRFLRASKSFSQQF